MDYGDVWDGAGASKGSKSWKFNITIYTLMNCLQRSNSLDIFRNLCFFNKACVVVYCMCVVSLSKVLLLRKSGLFVISKEPEQTQIASFLKKWKWECSPSSEYKRHFMPQKPHDFSFWNWRFIDFRTKCKHSLMKFWLIWSTAKLDLRWEIYSRDDKTCPLFRFLQIWVTTGLALMWHDGGRWEDKHLNI